MRTSLACLLSLITGVVVGYTQLPIFPIVVDRPSTIGFEYCPRDEE